MSLTRLGYASINVRDVATAVRHYTEVVGLRLIELGPDGRAYLQAFDNQDHHCVVLNPAGRAGIDHVGLKVGDPQDLPAVAQMLRERGVASREVPAGELRGQGQGLRFPTPSGHDFVLYYHADKAGYATGMRDPDPVPARPRIEAGHLDHVVITCERPQEMSAFLRESFGFYVTEEAHAPNGEALVLFLTCSNKMHDLAIIPGPNGGLHHLAFGVESRADVVTRTDIVKQRRIPALEHGITRHGISGVTTMYFEDPAGNRNECYNGAYIAPGAADRVPPIVWEPESGGRGLFYYEGAAPAPFLTVVT